MSGIAEILILLASSISSFAIEGLKVSVQQTNAILHWPSDPSETYIVQYRSNLSASASWLTLTDLYAADSSSNVTYFLHYNFRDLPANPNWRLYACRWQRFQSDPSTNSTGSGSTNIFPSTAGFYRVVRDGALICGASPTEWSCMTC